MTRRPHPNADDDLGIFRGMAITIVIQVAIIGVVALAVWWWLS